MRLTHIKLAGFKSFVDPTNIGVPGQLVGVVGPNGCGKSNIIDAVRWVLGESRASALRGESMQDVIFNGSSQRKPVGRASVELIFDNALGRAAGQWSQYAEISVKRVLTRENESTYLINNTVVRRRDIQDIFLGTGVGPRAYAIIEQGMISRVIEAKPEELRVFLEEAAGVSKYKERRRETEHRLEDTRENLARVDDIRRELDAQIEKLTRQAEVAKQYQTLKSEQETKQQLLWLIRKQDAQSETTKLGREIDRVTNEVEAETAKLREIERHLEATRTQHYEAGDAVNAAQGVLYGVNSEIARLESEIKYISETRQRLFSQGMQLVGQLAQWGRQSGELREALGMWQGRRTGLAKRHEETQAQAAGEAARLPAFEERLRAAQADVQAARERIVEVQRTLQVEEAHRANSRKSLEGYSARSARLSAERAGLAEPEAAEIDRLAEQLSGFDRQLARMDDDLAVLAAELPALEHGRHTASTERDRCEREAHHLDGRLATLRKIQARAERNEPLDQWLARHQLAALPRLWQKLEVEPGWEAAVESVLRERLHAVALEDPYALDAFFTTSDAPPAKLTIAAAGTAQDAGGGWPLGAARSLASVVHVTDRGFVAQIEEWLAGYFITETVPARSECLMLRPGTALVTRTGHQYRRHAVSFYAPDDGDAGLLARQREIDGLAREAGEMQAALAAAKAAFEQADTAHRGAIARANQLRGTASETRQARHRVELEHLKLAQARERVRERAGAIDAEIAEIAREATAEEARQTGFVATFATMESSLAALRGAYDTVHAGQVDAERALAGQRASIQGAEREAQEAAFAVRECDAKIDEVDRSLNAMLERIQAATQQERAVRDEVAGLQDAELRERLQVLLESRVQAEERLALARDKHESLTTDLRATEESRLAAEQQIGPLREQINELRLKEQAARLALEQFSQQLADAGANEEMLTEALSDRMRPNALQGEINRIGQAITALGAINMAALEELDTSRERKDYLDAQATDLAEALGTLEAAIKRIDLETRSLLGATFETVNKNFAELFPALFGGGQAQLVMTGEEILDAGVQVMAQPPGKRNQSIHLLSGGEKALTAISLVFALFKLNPAPFCLLDEVDAPLDDTNTERFCNLVKTMSTDTQFLYISHNKITMEMAEQLIGVTMQEQGVSRIVAVDIEEALKLREAA